MSPFIAELLGTMVMILLGDGVVANVVLKKTKGFQAGWITITTAWALAVFTGVVIAGPYSGAHLNPAITIGFAIAEKFPWASVGPYIIAQMLGAALGAFLVWIIYYDHFKATEDTGAKLGVFCTAPEIRHNIVNFGCELIATFVYKVGLSSGNYSFATAAGLFNSVVSFVLLVVVNQISKKLTDTSLF